MTNLRILIADDHDVVREGVRALVEDQPDWEVCGVAANGRQAIEEAEKLKPDVIVIDMTMPELNGVEAIRQIRRLLPKTEIVVFSGHRSEDMVRETFDAGAKSYICKADAGRYLIDAIRSLAAHKPFFTPEVSDILFAKFLNGRSGDQQRGDGSLTTREREIVRLLAEGHSNKEIGSTLGISTRTAETHRATLMRKLDSSSLADVVRYAIRNHIIEP